MMRRNRRTRAYSTALAILAAALLWASCGSAAARGIEFVGPVGYEINGNKVTIAATRIENSRAGGVSGTLSLELWARTTPDTNRYRTIASARIGELPANRHYRDIFTTTDFKRPPAGTYWISLNIVEHPNSNTALDTVRFDRQLVVSRQPGTVLPPPPELGGVGAANPLMLGAVALLFLAARRWKRSTSGVRRPESA